MSAGTAGGGAGDMLGGRYRTVRLLPGDRAGTPSAVESWLADDTILQRSVRLDIHRSGRRAAREFIRRALAFGAVARHPSLTRVLDVVDGPDNAYVVSAWVDGTTLQDVLGDGPLDSDVAAAMVAALADAVAACHRAGAVLGGLGPDQVTLAADRPVIAPRFDADGATTEGDIRDLGAILYAALTASWPASAGPLPEAPVRYGRVVSPRQLRAEVPTDLSTLAMRAMQVEGDGAVRTADALQQVLTGRGRPADLLPFGGVASGPQESPGPPVRGSGRRRVVTAAVILIGVITLGVVILALSRLVASVSTSSSPLARTAIAHTARPTGAPSTPPSSPTDSSSTGPRSADPTSTGPTSSRPSSSLPPAPTSIVGVKVFDPFYQPPGAENPGDAHLAADHDTATAWRTLEYQRSAAFGNLKPGAGLRFGLAGPTTIRQVQIQTPTPGITVQLLAGNDNVPGFTGYQRVTAPMPVPASGVITVPGGVTAKYWIVWLTALQQQPDGQFQGALGEVALLH